MAVSRDGSGRAGSSISSCTGIGDRQLREAAAAATGQVAPEAVPLRRIRPKDLLLTAALVFGAYLLISKLASIGFGTIAHELGQADIAWVVVALVLAQTTFLASGISVRGAVMTPLRCFPASCCSRRSSSSI
jgi:hypothetical protein